jgi:hypothetical protein
MKRFYAAVAFFCLAVPSVALADVTVSFPQPGAELMSPFTLQASALTCQSQPLSSIAYSIDSSRDTLVKANSISVQISAGAGAHTLRVKAWGNQGAKCFETIPITVLDALPTMPANVATNASIQSMTNWVGEHDPATNGSSTGVTSLLTGATQVNGPRRQFSFQYVNNGGHRFHVSFPGNASATHFVYDTYVMIHSDCGTTNCGNLANIEMDMNQVLSNGDVIIYGVQCDGWSRTWDYTVGGSLGSAWRHADVACDPHQWTRDVWHHVQLAYSRDESGNVTYESVSLDGDTTPLTGATGWSRFTLNWGPVLLTNFQLDGQGASGAQTLEIANTTVYAW